MLIPLLFMGDIVGRLFREFAVTLTVTILVSAGGPAHAHTDDVREAAQAHAPRRSRVLFYRKTGRLFDTTIEYYGATLQWVLRHQDATLLFAVSALVLTILLYIVAPKGFFPIQDTGVKQGGSESSPSASFPRWCSDNRRWRR